MLMPYSRGYAKLSILRIKRRIGTKVRELAMQLHRSFTVSGVCLYFCVEVS